MGLKSAALSKLSFFAGIFQVFRLKNQNSYCTTAPADGWFGGYFICFLDQKLSNINIIYKKPQN